MRARRCVACWCLVRRDRHPDSCAWPCSPLGFFTLLGGRVQSRRKWLKRALPCEIGRAL